MSENPMIDTLLGHVSVRKFSDRPVAAETLHTIVQCAQMAPTSCFYQAYTIIQVDDRQKREALRRISGEQAYLCQAPLVLLFCADLHRGVTHYEGVDPQVVENTEYYTVAVIDGALAAQKALVAAQALGLGGVMVGGIRNDLKAVGELFELPKLVIPLFAMCLGYPDDAPAQKPRLPLASVLKQDCYSVGEDAALLAQYNAEIAAYYSERTGGKETDSWAKRCGDSMMQQTRDSVGAFAKNAGLLRRD